MNLSTPKFFLCLFLFIVIGSIIYSNSLQVPFIMDDMVRIEKNPDVRIAGLGGKEFWKAAFGKYAHQTRPVANVTFALNYYLHKYELPGYHLVNICVHIFSGFFLFLFLNLSLQILRDRDCELSATRTLSPPILLLIALSAALIWFVNPLHTQSVTYIVQRQNSMAAMFYLLSFLLYLRGRLHGTRPSKAAHAEHGAKMQKGGSTSKVGENSPATPQPSNPYHYIWYAGSVLAWIFALACKEIAVILPFFVFLYEWYFFQNLNGKWFKKKLKYVLGIILLLGIITLLYLGPEPVQNIISSRDFANKEFSYLERILTQPRVVIYYLSLFFYPNPSRLNLDYDFALSHSLTDPATTLLSIFTIIGLIGLACYLARSQRLISFCIFWFFGNLVIESSIIPLAIIFEHRTYLPSMLIGLPVVILVFRYGRDIRFASALLVGVILLFSCWTYQRNEVWRDSVTLYRDSAEKSPKKPRPRFNLALALQRQGKPEQALPHYFEVLRLKPDYKTTHYNIGHALRRQGKPIDAIAHYKEEIRLNPDYQNSYYELANVLMELKRADEAIDYYLKALSIKPNDELANYYLGIALKKQGRTDEAIARFMQALRIKPDFEKALYQMAVCLAKQGRTDEAIALYRQILRANPNSEKTHHRLGIALQRKGRTEDAIDQYYKALRLNPENAGTYNNLGIALLEKGNIQGAIKQFQQALRIRPNFMTARNNLLRAKEMQEQGR